MTARDRIWQALIGVAAFTALGLISDWVFWKEGWFFIGLGVAASATFVEPHFVKPQDAIVNAAGGIGALFALEREPFQILWAVIFGAVLLVAASAVAAALMRDEGSRLKLVMFRTATRFGRSVVLGGAILGFDSLARAARGDQGAEFLALGSLVLLAAVGPNWSLLVQQRRIMTKGAMATAALGPRVVTIASMRPLGSEGATVTLSAGKNSLLGTIIAILPHQQSLRYQVGLHGDVQELCSSFPTPITIETASSGADVVGAVGSGSTDTSIEFEPLSDLPTGTPVALAQEDGTMLLYQVASQKLVRMAAGGAASIVAHAVATQVGLPIEGSLRSNSSLPRPHELVLRAPALKSSPPSGYYPIGRVKGTTIAVGVNLEKGANGHLAILGMSGMGKTAVATHVCALLGSASLVVALDLTGEYKGKLNIPLWDGNTTALGFSVSEPIGDPPSKARELIKSLMDAGLAEYSDPAKECHSRVVALEEAHSFVPEWNFALKSQQDATSLTTRMIMQARKYGLSFIIVSQRTAVVSKSALSQCENYIILRTIDETSLDYVQTLVGANMREAVTRLGKFEAVCVGPAFNSEQPVIVELDSPLPSTPNGVTE